MRYSTLTTKKIKLKPFLPNQREEYKTSASTEGKSKEEIAFDLARKSGANIPFKTRLEKRKIKHLAF